MTKDTKPDLFVIESLDLTDEKRRRFEGRILRDILRFRGKRVEYFYIRTEKELGMALDRFYDSKKRYLHISSHGNPKNVCLTLDSLTFRDFGRLAKPYLYKRRLFFSACEVVNRSLAEAVLPGSECYSLIGPRERIRFSDAVLMWASFYHLMFRDGEDFMLGGKIRWALRRVKQAFGIKFEYFRRDGLGVERVDVEKK